MKESQNVEADISAISRIGDEYAATLKAADLDGWISLWTDDGVQMPNDAPAIIGKELIREDLKSAFDQFIFSEFNITTEEIEVSEDLAYVRGTYTVILTPKKEGQPITLDGKNLAIFKRQIDGSWKIHRDIFNMNAPPKQE